MRGRRAPVRLKAPRVVAAKRGWRVTLGALSHRLGHRSEWIAAALLMSRGYQLLGFRLKTRAGEIAILARRGHTVVGVDVDPVLVAAAGKDHPDCTWLEGDLSELDLPASGIAEPFDLIVCAGNVMAFLAPGTAPEVLARFAAHLAPGGRAVVGFGAGRGYDFGQFFADAQAAGLAVDLRLATWDLRPLEADSDFLVAVLAKR